MFKIISMLYGLLYEIFFDDKEEYNIKSHKFKLTRVLGVVVFSLSILTNFWLYKDYIRVVRSKDCEPVAKEPDKVKIEEPPRPRLDFTESYPNDTPEEEYLDEEGRILKEGNRFKSIDEILEEERRKRDTNE